MKNTCELFNDGWLFAKLKIEPGAKPAEAAPEALDWQPARVPHDWLIFDTNNLYESAVGFYKKEFAAEKGERVFLLRFDGVYMDSSVRVNGEHVGEWKYGYSTFELDITDFLRDGINEIIVKVVYESPNSRWYSGAGIYRNVWLKTLNKTRVASDGVYITPAKKSGGAWEVEIDAEIIIGDENARIEIRHELRDPGGSAVAECAQSFPAGAKGLRRDSQRLTANAPSLWGIGAANIYALKTEVFQDGALVHAEENAFGFRTIEFDPNRGFFLNGERVKLQGVCQHHDLGALGAAMNAAALRRQLCLLKEMGANAIRTAHNMPAPELMDLADSMGFLVVSESFDMWEMPKTANDYARFFADWAEKDVASWVRRDRNHPSLIMWCIGNEIYETHANAEKGAELIGMLTSLVKKHDPKGHAPVTLGSNYLPWENTQKCADAVKLVGYNYADYLYNDHHKKYPDWIIYGSETCSVVQSRGVYHFPLAKSVLADDDEQCSSLGNSATSWGAKSAEACIMADRDAEFSAGQFIWSGTDYIGEPTPYHTKNSYFGQIDTAGFKKDSFYIFQSAWTDYRANPMIHIFPYWDFSDGQTIDVRVASNAPKVELFFADGEGQRSLGTFDIDHKKGKKLIADWQLPYKKGTLLAVAYDADGNAIAKTSRSSFGDAAQIVLTPDKTSLMANGEDLAFVEISAIDENAMPVENANNRISITVEGAGYLAGIDNGDSADYEQYKGASKRLFSGKLLAIVGATLETGEIKVTAQSPGLPAKTLALQAVKADIRKGISAAFVPGEKPEENGEVPVRKISLEVIADSGGANSGASAGKREIALKARIHPENATHRALEWRVTDSAGIDASIASISADGDGAVVTAIGDGDIFVRCATRNGGGKISLYSQLDFSVTGLGAAHLNPYGFIAGGLYNKSNVELTNGNERGVATLRDGESHVGFAGVDFGETGADEITMPIFSLTKEPFPIEIWEGMPGDAGGKKLATVTYASGSRWNTYIAETYKLPARIKGVATICFVLRQKAHIKGFSFRKIEKAYERICAKDHSVIYGDSYKITQGGIERIGNNVTIEFDGMDFSGAKPAKLQICGRTPLALNSIQVKFGDGSEAQMIGFSKAADFEVQEFDIGAGASEHGSNARSANAEQKVSFVFLPGCDFDFKWFRFAQEDGQGLPPPLPQAQAQPG